LSMAGMAAIWAARVGSIERDWAITLEKVAKNKKILPKNRIAFMVSLSRLLEDTQQFDLLLILAIGKQLAR
jgi:hypothetical protein